MVNIVVKVKPREEHHPARWRGREAPSREEGKHKGRGARHGLPTWLAAEHKVPVHCFCLIRNLH